MSTEIFKFDDRLDGDFLSSIYEDDNEHAEMVFENFVASIQKLITELEEACAGGEVELLRKKIHKIKPVLSYVGLTALTLKAENIEKNCLITATINDLAGLYTTFINELNNMIPVVENDLIKLKAQTI